MTHPQPQQQPTRRRGWLIALMVVIFIAVPLVEVWLLLQVGGLIGLWPTIGLLVLMAVLGTLLSKHEGAKAWRALNKTLETGRMPQGELADAALVLVGAVLLVFPGFFSDIVGLVFLLPFTRPLARKLLFLLAKPASRYAPPGGPLGFARGPEYGPGGPGPRSRRPGPPDSIPGEVIEGEVIDPDAK